MNRVLVIEDDVEIRAQVAELLWQAGHCVVEADNGRRAMQVFAPGHFDMVITDILTPDEDGLETIQAIRRIDPSVPVVAISDAVSVRNPLDYLKAALAFGASSGLRKPFGPGEFCRVVNRLLPLAA